MIYGKRGVKSLSRNGPFNVSHVQHVRQQVQRLLPRAIRRHRRATDMRRVLAWERWLQQGVCSRTRETAIAIPLHRSKFWWKKHLANPLFCICRKVMFWYEYSIRYRPIHRSFPMTYPMTYPFDELKNAHSRLADPRVGDPLRYYFSMYFACNCCGSVLGKEKEIRYCAPTGKFVKTKIMVCDACNQKFEWTRHGIMITFRKYVSWSSFPEISTRYLCFGGTYGDVMESLRAFCVSVA